MMTGNHVIGWATAYTIQHNLGPSTTGDAGGRHQLVVIQNVILCILLGTNASYQVLGYRLSLME